MRGSASLRRSLFFWLGVGLLSSEGLALLVVEVNHAGLALAAVLLTLAWWFLVGVVVVGGAAMLVTPSGARVERYGVPNGLTALRAWSCVPLLLIALLQLPGRTGLVLWVGVGGAAGLLDAVDGFLARRIGPVTALGKAMDPLMDALFFLTAAVGCFSLGITPLWLSLLIAFRYAAPVLVTPFVFLAHRRPELVHTVWGRRNTLLTGVVLFVLFWVRLAGGPVWLAALIAAVPTLVPTTLLHFASLLRRVADAPVVSP